MLESAREDLINNDIPEAINDRLECLKVDLYIDEEIIRDIYKNKIEIRDYVAKYMKEEEDYEDEEKCEEMINKITEIIEEAMDTFLNDVYLVMVIEDSFIEDTDTKYTIEGKVA
jgi:hypothetical protein